MALLGSGTPQKHDMVVRGRLAPYWVELGPGNIPLSTWKHCSRCGCSEGMIEQMGWTHCSGKGVKRYSLVLPMAEFDAVAIFARLKDRHVVDEIRSALRLWVRVRRGELVVINRDGSEVELVTS